MKMKRGLALLLALFLALSLAACAKNPEKATTTTAGNGNTSVTNTNNVLTDNSTAEDEATTTALAGQTTTAIVTKPGETTVCTTTRTKTTGLVQTTAAKVHKPFFKNEFKEDTKKFDEGLNFGGKTFTYVTTGALSDHLLTYKEGFEKEYNAKVKVQVIGSDEFWSKVVAKMIAKEPYDIIMADAMSYPTCVSSNVLTPLENYITTADLWDSDSYKEGGFSGSLAQGMSWDGHMYIAGGAYLASPGVVYYNKKMWNEAGLEDPLALYKAGKWTWEKLYEQCAALQDTANKKYGINIGMDDAALMVASYDTAVFKHTADGHIEHNLNDLKLYNALKTLSKFCHRDTAVISPNNSDDSGLSQLMTGTVAAALQCAGDYALMYNNAKSSAAFDKSAANLGVVPVPTPSTSKVLPVWQWMGYGACNGASKDSIMAALAYAKYDSKVNHLATYCEEMPDEIQKLMRSVVDTDNLISSHYGFESSAGSVEQVAKSIYTEVAVNDRPVAVALKAYQKLLEKAIAAAVSEP